MLKQAKQEVPSLELGPPSPSWMDQLFGSPPGDLKPVARHETPRKSEFIVQQGPQTPHRRVVASGISSVSRVTSTAKRACVASCESRKRAKSPSREILSGNHAKKRRVEPSGEKTTTTDLQGWSTSLTADALSETFLASSTMDMERDATEEFMNEFWGDLMQDMSPISNDSLIAAARPLEELHTPVPPAEPDCHLLDNVSPDQLLELAQFLEPVLPERAVLAATSVPSEQPPAPAPLSAEAPVEAPPIDLAALLEETEIVFSPDLPAAADPALTRPASLPPAPPCPPPPAAPATEQPTQYLLVLSSAEPEPSAAPSRLSVTSESTDDPDHPQRSWSTSTEAAWSTSTDVEPEQELEQELEVVRPRKRAPRQPPAATPAEKYRRIRDNNNEASRRSRQQRKQREADTQVRAEELEAENARLRQKVDVLEGLLEQVKALVPLLTARK